MRLALFATRGSRNARVLKHLHHGPAVAFRDGVQFVALIGGRLLARRNAQIKLALMRFVLFSYFCTCWKVIPITSPSAV
jgi:hypothetical protein